MQIYLKKQLLVTLCVYIGQILCGYVGGWSAPIIPRLQDPEQTTLPEPITDAQASVMGSFLYLGVLFGSLIAGYIAHKFGRKLSLMIGGAFTFVGQLTALLSGNFGTLVAARAINGFGLGTIFNINLVYLTEMASTTIRGALLTGTGVSMSLGTVLVYSIGPYVPIPVTLYIGMATSLSYVVGLYFIPESPIFKMLQGKDEEAKQILESLGRIHDLKDLMVLKVEDKENKNNNWDIIKVKSNRKALFILIVLFTLLSMSGSIAVVFYATSIFDLANMNLDSNISTIIIGVTMLVSSFLSPIFVERIGRRILLIVSSGLSCICQASMGLYFFLEDGDYPVVESLRWLPLVSMMCFFIAFNSGLAIIPSTLIGELFSSEVRSLGSAVTLTFNWIFGFVTSLTFGPMIAALGGYITFWMYSGICGIAFIFSIIFVPETKGKSLIEIQDMMNK